MMLHRHFEKQAEKPKQEEAKQAVIADDGQTEEKKPEAKRTRKRKTDE